MNKIALSSHKKPTMKIKIVYQENCTSFPSSNTTSFTLLTTKTKQLQYKYRQVERTIQNSVLVDQKEAQKIKTWRGSSDLGENFMKHLLNNGKPRERL